MKKINKNKKIIKKINKKMIGIDLGTTYCCFGHWKNNKVEIIPNYLGKRKTLSIVIFTENRPLLGEYSEGPTIQYYNSA